MARKRKPLVVNDETVELDAADLQITQKPNGEVHQHWIATKEARARGICLALSGYIATLRL